MAEDGNGGYVTMKTFIVTMTVVITSVLGICGAVAAFIFESHTSSGHPGMMTVERYEQLSTREEQIQVAQWKAVENRLASIERKLDRLSP